MNPKKLIIEGLYVILMGMFILWKKDLIIYWVGVTLIIMAGLLHHKYRQVLYSLGIAFVGILHFVIPNLPLFLVSISISIVFLLHACIHFITFLLHYKNRSWDFMQEFVFFIFYIIFAALVFMNPSSILLLIGIYFIIYGLCDIKEAIFEHYHIYLKSYIRHKARIDLPIVLSVLTKVSENSPTSIGGR